MSRTRNPAGPLPRSSVGAPRRPSDDVPLPPIVGASARMQRLLRLVQRVAPTESTVLILGESGTGKELVARSLHVLSRRAQGPFVPVNVGALSESLIESELFGYAKGAFTGATSDRAGLVEEAHRGTLFLDEIGDMPLATQVKLLRTLENNEVRRVGENAPRLVDVRVVAATHRDLQSLVAEGTLPRRPLLPAERRPVGGPRAARSRGRRGAAGELLPGARREAHGRKQLRFSPEAMALLRHHEWPGNVRELENAIEHAVAVSDHDLLTASDLPSSVRSPRLLMAPRDDEPHGALAGRGRARARAARSRVALARRRHPRARAARARSPGRQRHGGRACAGVSRTTPLAHVEALGGQAPIPQGEVSPDAIRAALLR
jgi:DNA-binding NtrC family response regulator